MKCLDGELLETKYEWPNLKSDVLNEEEKEEMSSEMVEKTRTQLKKNSVAYINGRGILIYIQNAIILKF